MTEWNAVEYAQHSSLQAAMAAQVLSLLQFRGDERVLDVGCGDGKITAEIATRCPQGSVVGVDASPDMIHLAREQFRAPHLRFEVAEAQALPFRNEFDLVVSFNALHWVPAQEVALRGIHAALTADGKAQLRLVVAGPRKSLETAMEETRQSPPWMKHYENFRDPYLRLTDKQYQELAERAGFRVLTCVTNDQAWNFESRAAFAAFAAAGSHAWTDQLPRHLRAQFIEESLDRYAAVAIASGARNIFRFYQMDIALAKNQAAAAIAT